MRDFYYYSDKANENQNHVIHRSDCSELPPLLERTLIGLEVDFIEAIFVAEAVTRKENFEKCIVCSSREFRENESKITKF